MGEQENVKLIEQMWSRISAQDPGAFEACLTEDCIQEWPQSRERVLGRTSIIAINENYPGLPKATLRRTTAAGDVVVSEVDLDYGGKVYHAVSIFMFRDGKVVHETDYFAEPFDAPGWRAQWVERI